MSENHGFPGCDARELGCGGYSGRKSARLRRSLRALATCALTAAIGLGAGGCSYRLGSMFGASGGEPPAERTASVGPSVSAARATRDATPEADLVYAKAAAAELMARGTTDVSQPWENPRTGARGTVTPIASIYTRDGAVCRDFMASYMRGSTESWYRGDACREGSKWVVREFRALQRT